ncbi:MAG: energy transducer TonB, partial [Acidobacteriota bacterium]
QRILPGIARRLYGEGKNAFEKKAFDEAAVRLGQAVRVMEVLDGGDESLADLRTLAAGFLDLAKASAATPEAPSAPAAAAAPAALAAPAPPVSLPISGPARGPATRAAVPTTVPVVVQQELPPWPAIARGPLFQGQFRGMIEIDIDERGDVVGVDIIEPIHPTYDAVLLKAAWDWKYRPATLDGQPVKSQKRVEVVLRP